MRAFPDLVVEDVAANVAFYRDALGLEVLVDLGWYAELGHHPDIVLVAFVERDHPTVPDRSGLAQGLLVSFEVDDAEERAVDLTARGYELCYPLTRELGQLHFMLRDPQGLLVDIIERCALTPDDRRRLASLRRDRRRPAS